MAVSKEHFLTVSKKIDQQRFESRNIAVNKSASLAYFSYRLKRPLLKRKYNNFQKDNLDKPWLTPDAIKALELLLQATDIGLEYGSGRSTKFFASLLRHLTSIEHHEGWYENVKQELNTEEFDNVDYLLKVPKGNVPNVHFSSEKQHFTSERDYPIEDSYFQDYIDALDEFPESHFDFALIDGRARRSCSRKAIEKIKPGGLLVLDNAERVRYAKVHKALTEWDKLFTTTGLTDTVIWRKP